MGAGKRSRIVALRKNRQFSLQTGPSPGASMETSPADDGNASGAVTRVFDAFRRGEVRAADQLLPLVYDELRRLAAARLAREAPGQTLQPTALVHEAYLRVLGPDPARPWDGTAHFYAAAAEAMRRILIDRARDRQAAQAGRRPQPQPSRPRRTHRRGRLARRPHRPRRGPGPTRADRRPGGRIGQAAAFTPDCRSTRPQRPWAWSAVPPSATGHSPGPGCSGSSLRRVAP